MNIPVTLGFDDKKIIGFMVLNDDINVDWLKEGISEAVQYCDGETRLIKLGIVLRKNRINKELIVKDNQIGYKEKEDRKVESLYWEPFIKIKEE